MFCIALLVTKNCSPFPGIKGQKVQKGERMFPFLRVTIAACLLGGKQFQQLSGHSQFKRVSTTALFSFLPLMD
jgi:hypothetical protein